MPWRLCWRHGLAGAEPTAAESAKDGFVSAVDGYCIGFVGVRPSAHSGTGFDRIAADDLDVLTTRNRMNLAWNAFPVPPHMAPKDIGAFESIKSYYFAASDLLQAAVSRARARDIDGYALDTGLYRQTNAAFLKASTDFGFTHLNYYWTADDVPKPDR